MLNSTFESLPTTIATQKEISANLKVFPLKDIIGQYSYGIVQMDKLTPVAETGFPQYFNPNVQNRKYYRNEAILVRENVSDDLEIIAEFDKEKEIELSFTPIKKPGESRTGGTGNEPELFDSGLEKKKIKYLPFKHLCLVKKGGRQEAIDLVYAWQAKPSQHGRPIGLLMQDEPGQAAMGRNAILFKDVTENKTWHIHNAKGSSDTGESLPPHFATALSGAKATQKDADIPEEIMEMLDSMTRKTPQWFRLVLKNAASIGRGFFKSPLTKLSEKEDRGKSVLTRLERNALAANLYFIWQVRKLGFKILPELSNDDLVNLTNKVWQRQKEAYQL